MPEELCRAEEWFARQRKDGTVVVFASGFHPSGGYVVQLKVSDAPSGTVPPEFKLLHTPPAEPSGSDEDGYSFGAQARFHSSEPISHVVVHDRNGSYSVRVEPPWRPDPPDRQVRHFYIYNECYKPISALVNFVPLGESNLRQNTEVVQPGNQRLLCITAQSSVLAESSSEDGVLHWIKTEVSLSQDEYTHVIACKCPEAEADCELPQAWPIPTSRQYPADNQ